jgi:cold shock CspA family protein
MKGVIVSWTGRGFGFVRDIDGYDHYAHIRNFQNWSNQKQPTVGQWVEFDLAPARVDGRNQQEASD